MVQLYHLENSKKMRPLKVDLSSFLKSFYETVSSG